MRTRPLGRGGPEVSVVGLGTNTFGAKADLALTRSVVDTALEEGVTLIDTADTYSQGLVETYLGRVLKGRRDRIVLATKFGMAMDDGPDIPRGTRAYIRWAIEGSLRRLETDVIDLYQMHRPDPETPIEETLGALNELVEEGKVRFIGSSYFDPAQLEEAEAASLERRSARFVSAQNWYSFLTREAEDGVLPTCERLGIGVLPYFPLESGLLTGKYRRGEIPTSGRLAGRPIPDEEFDRVEALERFAEARGISLLDVALGGLLAMPAVSSVIPGATKPEQVRANVRAGAWVPSAGDVAELNALR
jgi:aryl-alcohol dehydrogenase-like predicted oxidoreductase